MDPNAHGSESPTAGDLPKREVAASKGSIPSTFLSTKANIVNCYKQCSKFFQEREAIPTNVLISYWMMAGCLGPVRSVEEACQKGQDLLDGLIQQRMLSSFRYVDRDLNMIEFVKSEKHLKPIHCKHQGFCIPNSHGDFVVADSGLISGAGSGIIDSIILTDGMLKQKKVAANLNYNPSEKSRYVAHFNPTTDSVNHLLENHTDLSILVLRGCDELLSPTSFPLYILWSLTVLEISGSTRLKAIPANTISKLTQLRYLNLSHLLIKRFPPGFFPGLEELRWLILRGCSNLRQLYLSNLNLKSIDLSYCTSLQGVTYIRLMGSELNVVDLSYTNLDIMPFHSCEFITHLFLRDSKLSDTCYLRPLEQIRVLDLSGSWEVNCIARVNLLWLKVIDLSRTQIESVEFLISGEAKKTRCLILRECISLKELPAMKSMVNLEVLDVSGCDKLLELPEDLSLLSNLKDLNLSGCSGLGILAEGLFDQMSSLLKLDLSSTNVEVLPDLSKLGGLKELLLAECLRLRVVPDLQTLTNLETLDLSLSLLQDESEPHKVMPLSAPSSLRKLVLTNRSGLQNLFALTSLGSLEFLDLRGTDVRSIPRQYIEQIKCIHLPAGTGFSEVGQSEMGRLEEATDLDDILLSRVSKPSEIHIVSRVATSLSNNREASSSNQGSGFNQFEYKCGNLYDLISEMMEMIKSSIGVAQTLQLEMLRSDVSHIERNRERLKSSQNQKEAEELLQELMDATTHLSAADFLDDSTPYLTQLLRIVTKLKLLIPTKLEERLGASQPTMKKKKKKPWFHKSKEDDIFIVKDSSSHEFKDLLSSYVSLTIWQQYCLLCFSAFPLDKDENDKVIVKDENERLVDKDKEENESPLDEDSDENEGPLDEDNDKQARPCSTKQGLRNDGHNPGDENELGLLDEDNDKKEGGLKSLMVKKRMLIYLWIGEGFLDYSSADMSFEKAGKAVLRVLEDRGFIEPAMEKGRESGRCCMLPFVHEFVTVKAKEEGFFDFDPKNGKLTPHFTRSQRACLLETQANSPSSCRRWADDDYYLENKESFKNARTLFNVNESVVRIRHEWFSKMKHLKVLHLGNWRSNHEDPIEVYDVKFLEELKSMKIMRLLSLHGLSRVRKLADSVLLKLTNLIILDLRECTDLEELPADIGSLKSLTHLDLTGCIYLLEFPKGIRLLSKLEVLKGFVITIQNSDPQNRKACKLKDLLNLNKLRKLNIVVRINVFPDNEELQVFKDMDSLSKLKITWEKDFNFTNSEWFSLPEAKNEAMRPNSKWTNKLECWSRRQDDREETSRNRHMGNIEKLELWCYPLETEPHWLNPGELKSLKKLYICGGHLAKLQCYTNRDKWNVTTLRFKYLPNLGMGWRDLRNMFPELTYLEKHQCPKLPFLWCDDEGVWIRGREEY